MKRNFRTKEQTKCPACGNENDNLNYINCTKCREFMKEYSKRVRVKRKTLGLCIKCGRVVEDKRYSSCLECRIYSRDYRKKLKGLDGNG